jgi:hypothetical protein
MTTISEGALLLPMTLTLLEIPTLIHSFSEPLQDTGRTYPASHKGEPPMKSESAV